MWPDIAGTRNTRLALDRDEARRMSSRLCRRVPQDRRMVELVDDRTTVPIRVGLVTRPERVTRDEISRFTRHLFRSSVSVHRIEQKGDICNFVNYLRRLGWIHAIQVTANHSLLVQSSNCINRCYCLD